MKLLFKLVFFFITLSNISAQDELCATGPMLVPDPYNCQQFYMCSNDGFAYEMSCGIGNVFSRALQVCVNEDDTVNNDCVLEPLSIEQRCASGATFIPHPSECQLYFNCSFRYNEPIPRYFEQHMLECDYPAYFNTETNACDDDFENVDCGNRTRHIDACSYRRNWCPVAHSNCCSIGSCKCKENGFHENDRRLWSPFYTLCFKERAKASLYCQPDTNGMTQIFHPLKKMCLPLILIPQEHGGLQPFCEGKGNGDRCDHYTICVDGGVSNHVACGPDRVWNFLRSACCDWPDVCGRCGALTLNKCYGQFDSK